MKFSIITPSFNSAGYLRQCIASVADQGVEFEHLVQDAGSTDGTREILAEFPHLDVRIEPDEGMYDAINRGLRRATGDICAWLNCDEQYLPGTLATVAEWFDSHPSHDVLVGGIIVTRPDGSYLCDRIGLAPTRWHTLVSGTLSFASAAAFFRKKIIVGGGHLLPKCWKAVGDAAWAANLLGAGIRFGSLKKPLATFTYTGDNLSHNELAAAERLKLADSAPKIARCVMPFLVVYYRVRKLIAGGYHFSPHSYKIFSQTSPNQRQLYLAEHPTHKWPR